MKDELREALENSAVDILKRMELSNPEDAEKGVNTSYMQLTDALKAVGDMITECEKNDTTIKVETIKSDTAVKTAEMQCNITYRIEKMKADVAKAQLEFQKKQHELDKKNFIKDLIVGGATTLAGFVVPLGIDASQQHFISHTILPFETDGIITSRTNQQFISKMLSQRK